MNQFIIKTLVSAVIIVVISIVGIRFPGLGISILILALSNLMSTQKITLFQN